MRDRRLTTKSRDLSMRVVKDDLIDIPSLNQETGTMDFSKIRVGVKQLEDAVIDNPLRHVNPQFSDKNFILRAITNNDTATLRRISEFYFRADGIYTRLVKYMANLYRYDWYITPFINGGDTYPMDNGTGSVEKDALPKDITAKDVRKYLDSFFKVLKYLDDFNVKLFCKNAALKVIKYGVYYGYICNTETDNVVIQELDADYCRSRYTIHNRPVVEFNMKYFKDMFRDNEYRMRVLKLFPKEFQRGYKLYEAGKLPGDFQGDTAGWYLLDTNFAFKLNMGDGTDDFPPLISTIPAILDFVEGSELNKKKAAQRLMKIIIQKLPLDKNGDLVFDPDEVQQLHNNAVAMLSRAIGIDVLTTFADVDVANMEGTSASANSIAEDTKTAYDNIFKQSGISTQVMTSNGNIATEKSIINDVAVMDNLLLQFQDFLNMILEKFNKNPKKAYYKAQFLGTTIYNYQELAKIYKDQAQMGYSKMLPQVAMGVSQSTVLATAFFENDLLNLVSVLVPPLTSNTMNAEALQQQQNGRSGRVGVVSGAVGNANSGDGAGRPEKSESEKSDKTLQNIESKN